jgi:predicted metal-binding protein
MTGIVQPVLFEPEQVSALCRTPYPNHPHGCPNFGKKKGCPPAVVHLRDYLDLTQPVHAIWTTFDLGAHRERMMQAHPQWTCRQLDCCLYWQPKARKNLGREIVRFLSEGDHHHLVVVGNPEAAGVNLTDTMKSIGIDLEWPPDKTTYQIALVGTLNMSERITQCSSASWDQEHCSS